MPKLIYWVCECLDDHKAYNIRTRTRREAKELRVKYGPKRFGEPEKVIVEYDNAFDLLTMALGEGGLP